MAGFVPMPGYAHLHAQDPVSGERLPPVEADAYGPLLAQAYLGQWGHCEQRRSYDGRAVDRSEVHRLFARGRAGRRNPGRRAVRRRGAVHVEVAPLSRSRRGTGFAAALARPRVSRAVRRLSRHSLTSTTSAFAAAALMSRPPSRRRPSPCTPRSTRPRSGRSRPSAATGAPSSRPRRPRTSSCRRSPTSGPTRCRASRRPSPCTPVRRWRGSRRSRPSAASGTRPPCPCTPRTSASPCRRRSGWSPRRTRAAPRTAGRSTGPNGHRHGCPSGRRSLSGEQIRRRATAETP